MLLSLLIALTALNPLPAPHETAGLHSAATFSPVATVRDKTPSRKVFKNTRLRPFPQITNVPWDGHFSARNFRNTSTDRSKLREIKKNLRTTILAVPQWHTSALKNLEIRKRTHASRGLGNSETIILNTDSIDNSDELISVFLHEIGHVVDFGGLQGKRGRHTEFYDGKTPILSDDKSLNFYRISWTNATSHKRDTSRNDFVSGYAETSPFEDFAESYILYRLHGEKFRYIAQKSQQLRQKYEFMKREVFSGREFQFEKPVKKFAHGILWDVTLLSIDKPVRIAQ